MNLTTDQWIPAIRADGRHELHSLCSLFAEAHALRDLAVKPHERIALMRLIVCITQAALDGPEDEDDWLACQPRIQPAVAAYLEQWKDAFELLGDGPRFLQLPNLQPGKETDEGNSSTKLDLTLSTGNNSVLFDNEAGSTREVACARAALNLITFQCFSPGGRIGVARWQGKETAGKGSSNHAPCTPSSMLHTLLVGDTLLTTISFNLLTKELAKDHLPSWGKPVWELPVVSPVDTPSIQNATASYLGRLVPISRAIRLNEDGRTIILANGLDYPIFPTFREATATVVQRKGEELGVLPASTARSIWRQLSAITVKRIATANQIAGPLALSLAPSTRDVTLWIGALVTDKAKIEDVVESTYTVPSALFDPAGRSAYENGVQHAEFVDSLLSKAVGAYSSALKIDKPAYDRARQHFWTRVEQNLSDLFAVARELTPPDDLPASPWGKVVRQAAFDAYERTCPVGTPRQLQAHALGLRHLHRSSAKPTTKTKASKK